ncbi:MAG: VWA domain-containing protein [Myxococcales bacterium]|nr:VWA domain-containing protein [Myxococcales bacterium]
MIPIAIEPDLTYARRDCGWGALDTAMGRLPLAAVDIDARVVGLTSTTEVRQTFVNHLREAIEATYVFPLPDRAAVQRFRMVAGDRVIEGVLDERGAARASYDQAIARGQRAAIAEEDRAGVFTLRVGNVMPGEVVTIALTLSGPVPIDDGEVTWVFPLVVAPRYVPGAPLPGEQAGLGVAADTDAVPDASRISPPVLLPGMPSAVRLGVRLSVDGGGLPVAQLRANLADVDARADGRGWQIALRPGQRLDRDLVLRWQLGGASLASSAVWAPDAAGAGGTLAVTVVPPIGSAAGGRPRDVVVVLDRSGSMEGWKMVAARRAAARIVDSLTERDRLAVIAFDNQCESPRAHGGALVPATDRHRFEAVQFLAGVEARGGTELAEPLRRAAALLRSHPAHDQVLVLVTDGQVGNEDQLLAAMGGELGRLRVFTLGIDQAVNAAFLRRLAGLGGGACELVESEDRLDEVMGKIHRRIATPILTDLAIDGRFLDAASQAPRRLPSVFAGAPVTVYLRCAGASGARTDRDGPRPAAGRHRHRADGRARLGRARGRSRGGVGPRAHPRPRGSLRRRREHVGPRARDRRDLAAPPRAVALHRVRGDRSRGGEPGRHAARDRPAGRAARRLGAGRVGAHPQRDRAADARPDGRRRPPRRRLVQRTDGQAGDARQAQDDERQRRRRTAGRLVRRRGPRGGERRGRGRQAVGARGLRAAPAAPRAEPDAGRRAAQHDAAPAQARGARGAQGGGRAGRPRRPAVPPAAGAARRRAGRRRQPRPAGRRGPAADRAPARAGRGRALGRPGRAGPGDRAAARAADRGAGRGRPGERAARRRDGAAPGRHRPGAAARAHAAGPAVVLEVSPPRGSTSACDRARWCSA